MEIDCRKFMERPDGSLVPIDKVKPLDKLRDQTVRNIIEQGVFMSAKLASFKDQVFEEFETFCKISFEEYDKKYGGKKGNITLTSYDGKLKVEIHNQDVISFDERLQVAKQLIDDCIHKWSNGVNDNLRALVNNAFQVDKQGNVNTRRILELRQLDIEDKEWKDAMEAISSSIKILESKRYMRIYRKAQNSDSWNMVALDFASI